MSFMDFSENVSSNIRYFPKSFPKQSRMMIGNVTFIEKTNDEMKSVIELIEKTVLNILNCISFCYYEEVKLIGYA